MPTIQYFRYNKHHVLADTRKRALFYLQHYTPKNDVLLLCCFFRFYYVCKRYVIFNSSWSNSQLSPGSASFSIQTEILRNGKWFSKHKNGNIIETGNAFCLDCKSRAQIRYNVSFSWKLSYVSAFCFEYVIRIKSRKKPRLRGLFTTINMLPLM